MKFDISNRFSNIKGDLGKRGARYHNAFKYCSACG